MCSYALLAIFGVVAAPYNYVLLSLKSYGDVYPLFRFFLR